MRITIAPLQRVYTASDNPHFDGDLYQSDLLYQPDVELAGQSTPLSVTVSNHSNAWSGQQATARRNE
jgi:hypothetical protein